MNTKSKTKLWIAAFALACWPLLSEAKVYVETTANGIEAYTDEIGLAGYHGCTSEELQEVPAYVFILLARERGKEDCTRGNTDGETGGDGGTRTAGWEEINRLSSEGPTVAFDNLPEGDYRIECLVGQAIGCQIEGSTGEFPNQSIVYHQEKSSQIYLGNAKRKNTTATQKTLALSPNQLVVFPNPSAHEINIQLDNPGMGASTQIALYDLLGRALIQKTESTKDAKQAFHWTMDVGQFSEGTYLLMVNDEKGNTYQQKIIVQKD